LNVRRPIKSDRSENTLPLRAPELPLVQEVTTTAPHRSEMSAWQRWLHHPESSPAHRFLFQTHLWVGMTASLYVFVMGISGSTIVYRNQLEASGNPQVLAAVEWLVDFHSNLLGGDAGRLVNGIGAISLTLLCLTGAVIWWPGVAHWRRSLTVNWKSSFARTNWDLHNVLGFWCFLFVIVWGISGMYFSFPEVFNGVVDAFGPDSPAKLRFGDQVLSWLSNLHFGRFNGLTEAIWVFLGLVPAILSFTGLFMCCHRLLVRKGAPLPR
jgi:uncharacterized iron-regulated membrane protein